MRRLVLTAVMSFLMVGGVLPAPAQAQKDGSGVEKLWQRYPLEEGGKAVAPPTSSGSPGQAAAPVDVRPGLPPAAPAPDSTSDSKSGWLTLSLLAPLVVVLVALLIEGLSRRRRLRRPRRRRRGDASKAWARNVALGHSGRDDVGGTDWYAMSRRPTPPVEEKPMFPLRDARAAQPMRDQRPRTPVVRADSDDRRS